MNEGFPAAVVSHTHTHEHTHEHTHTHTITHTHSRFSEVKTCHEMHLNTFPLSFLLSLSSPPPPLSLSLAPEACVCFRARRSAPACCVGQTGSSRASCRRSSDETPPSTVVLPHLCYLEAGGRAPEHGEGEGGEKGRERRSLT